LLVERGVVLRARVPVLRDDLAPSPLAALARELDDAFLAPLARLDAPSEELARAVALFFAAPPLEREALAPAPVERELLARDALDRPLPEARVLVRDDEADEDAPELPLEVSSLVHLPDITRCAASATASAISDPSLVALDITLLAAWVAVSAASSPASRIARRAFGLALIAAAAAASPAASISLLIAALASLSTVSLPLPAAEPDEPLRADLAIV
jgi:hypothetical protein